MIKDKIEQYLTNQFTDRIINTQDFFFQKGQDALQKWLNLSINNEDKSDLEKLAADYDGLQKLATKRQTINEILNLLFEIVSYCDSKAKSKDYFNQYDDNRTLAVAYVRMNHWIEKLIIFKFNTDAVPVGSIRNAINYLLNPTNNATILSENHRAMISQTLFKKEYNPHNFIKNLEEYFSSYQITVSNSKNYTYLLSCIIYFIRKEWLDDIIGLMASDNTPWKDNAINNMQGSDCTILWNSKRPTGTNNTLKMLRSKINDGGYFKLFYSVHGNVQYVAEIIDFVENDIQLKEKNWPSIFKKIDGYENDFIKYNDDNKSAKIVFLTRKFEKIQSIPATSFATYKGWAYPVQDNLTPIISEPDIITIPTNNNSATSSIMNNNYKSSLNQILYGPPGTGKTYNTILEAAKIISGNENISYEDALEEFNTNLNNQIEFITFHQNYTYEDFIQGIRPDIENEKELSFEKKDGIFKRIADRALFEYYIENQKLKTTSNELFVDPTEAYLDFFNQLSVGQEFATKKNKKINIIQLNKNKNIVFKYENGSKPVLVSSNRLLKLYSKIPDINQIQNINEDVRAAIGGCDASAYYTMLREFIIFYDENKKRIQDEEDYQDTDYLDITEERKKEILSQITLNELRNISKDSVKKYVIIIDEINRANISRVFGELITLIEEDKRSHGKIPMRVTLPSGDTFIVPSNLHIIGTMNTADKSITLLDIALRRRFEFVPMYPLYEGFKDSIYFPDILQKMNEKIKKIKGPDFQIGHAYFMENDNLLEIMNRKVIPLLLEYFMNDETQVKEIITIDGYLVDENSWPMKLNKV
ncbi:hypothetical protein FLA105534_04939 [Flavobacterium bizetiae]|uniref:ATPase dynein-related AAA domain-containing protein n=1 Tax=Flavobacterium bizetiae TaxID=2704140 RepID=A0A6J4GY07_9FLAO|nr:AAA family ATPase [Flavobacterium bizetiae]CAA9203757.1 hypothetical protein FLA105534_04939 [Flavobacterium bizetiae]CAD5344498.1 hypothetical protein FLA105535_04504 [Flavobacterium bizetiae]CAD5350284.1 hypothetical protein FLA105534_04274 [Flavobacterium bizetiae]